jgi:hypothetical protein
MVFAARYVNATKASGCLGKPGLTIDPLVPDTDVFEHEKRNAFPLEVPAGESRVVWVDVFVPADAPSGTVQGQVVVQHGALRERREERRNISLTILDFTLPSTPSMESLFGFGGAAAVQQAHSTGPDQASRLVDRYVQAGLANRVSHADWLARADTQDQMAAANYTNGSSTGRMFEKWASTHARKYDGIDVPGPGGQVSLRGAKLTSAQLPTPFCSVHPNRSGYIKHNCSASDIKQQVSYWRQMYAAWERRGWADLLFDYTIDEPGCFSVSGQPVAWETLKETVGWVKEASPSLRSLVTVDMGHARKAGVIDEIDVFVPLINDLWPKEFLNGTRVCHPQGVGMNDVGANLTVSKDLRALYDGVNKTLWTYQSCMSYGCGPTSTCSQLMKHSNGPCSVHWPSYAIDHANEASAGVANRVMEWASYIERVQGELYYSTTVNFKSPNASWDEAKFYGANGDGYM